MADLLNSNEIFFQNYENKVKNRFYLYADGIPSFLLSKCKRPSVKSEKKTIDYINTQRYFKGKTTWDNITFTLHDAIVPAASQAVMEWIRLSHESVTGRDGYQDFYKKDLTINMLDPVGAKVEEWTLKGAWIVSADFEEADYSSDDPIDVNVELSVDYCILQY